MHRFFTTPENFTNDSVELDGSEVHHLRTVLRLTPGDIIEVLDGKGRCCEVELKLVNSERASGKILAQKGAQVESPVAITMGLALLKGKAMDTALRKAVELGVYRVVPVMSVRTVVKLKPDEIPSRVERWNEIVKDAVKQCGRVRVPEVANPETVLTFCQSSGESSMKLLFWENETETLLSDITEAAPLKAIDCLIGPEGGFSEEEVRQAKEAGFLPVSLGPRILRAETAPLVALTLLQYRWGDLSSGCP